MARFSIEVEYKSFGISLSQAPILWCDNCGANYLFTNPIFHYKTNHMNIDVHFIWNQIAAKCFYTSHEQIADALTKLLFSNRFHQLKTCLNVLDTPLGLRRHIKLIEPSLTSG